MTRARILADYVSSGDELAAVATTANGALQRSGGVMTGAITTNSTFDGVDIATRDAIHAPKANPAFTGTPTGITAAHLEAGVLPSDVTYPDGHIIQRVSATLTNLSTGEITGGQANAVADAIGQITITSGNGVLIYWTTRLTITAGTNCLGAARIAEGTVASVGTVLKSQYFGTTGDPGYGTYHAPSIWVYDSSPADTTPDYVLITEPQSSSTQGIQSYGAPDNACMLFEVVQ